MKKKFLDLKKKLSRIFNKHHAFVVLLGLLLLISVVVIRLNVLSSLGPDQGTIDEETEKIKTVNFSEDALEKIQQLRESNVKVPGTDISENRDNPFSE